jgi:hypothetical protein
MRNGACQRKPLDKVHAAEHERAHAADFAFRSAAEDAIKEWGHEFKFRLSRLLRDLEQVAPLTRERDER